jgi:branched-chain amino acid transport system permease protein
MLPSSEYKSIMPYYFIALFIALFSLLTTFLLVRSRIGLAFIAIREDEQAAVANGIHVLKYKILAFAVGAFFTGMAGSLYGYYLFIIQPSGFFNLNWALQPVLMTVLGGIGTIMGPVVGAFVLAAVFELTKIWFQEIHPIFAGAFIILLMLFLPEGLMSLVKKSGGQKVLQSVLFLRKNG